MATDPNAPPESIIVGKFDGIKNLVARERLGQGDLEAAVNVDIDDAGQIRRRRGQTLGSAGNFHSLWNTSRGVLGVKNGDLGWVDTNLNFRTLQAGVGNRRVAYVQVGFDIYFSSEQTSGIISAGDFVLPWGASNSAGTWISPVINPTDTLGAISGKLLGAPPLATELEVYKGRIYLAQGKTLWATELYVYNYVDKTRTYFQFEDDITLVMAVNDGLYVGTTGGLYFLKGTLTDGLPRTNLTSAAVIPGSGMVIPASRIHPQARQSPVPDGAVVAFLTSEGLFTGLDSGEVYNLTRERMVFPVAQSAAAMYREQDGITSCVVVTDNGGTPKSKARIGDYCDAEIIRAADRGV